MFAPRRRNLLLLNITLNEYGYMQWDTIQRSFYPLSLSYSYFITIHTNGTIFCEENEESELDLNCKIFSDFRFVLERLI